MDDAGGHRYFEGLAVAHVLGGLDDSEGRVFRAHLLDCGSCRARVGELRAIAHDLADVERDERRVRAAQAIDTKRRESDDEVDETVDPMPSQRSSRVTVIVGLVLIIGLSLWNFTLRSGLVVQQQHNLQLLDAGVIAESGEVWTEAYEADGVDGTIKSAGTQFLVVLDGVQAGRRYEVDAIGGSVEDYEIPPAEGTRVYRLFNALPSDTTKITITTPSGEEGNPALKIYEAIAP
jgi:hypothetical protein